MYKVLLILRNCELCEASKHDWREIIDRPWQNEPTMSIMIGDWNKEIGAWLWRAVPTAFIFMFLYARSQDYTFVMSFFWGTAINIGLVKTRKFIHGRYI